MFCIYFSLMRCYHMPSSTILKTIKPTFLVGLCIFALCSCNRKPYVIEGEREDVVLYNQERSLVTQSVKQVLVHLPQQVCARTWDARQLQQHHSLPQLTQPTMMQKWRIKIHCPARALVDMPVADESFMYGIDGQNYVYKVHKKTGKIAWTRQLNQTKKNRVEGGVCLTRDTLICGTDTAQAVCFDKNTGKEQWRQDIEASCRGNPICAHGRVFFLTVDNHVCALDAQKGTHLWMHTGIMHKTTLIGSCGMHVDNQNLIIPYTSGEVFCLDQKTGSPAWGQNLVGAKGSLNHVKAQPVADNKTIYLISNNNMCMAVDKQEGHVAWHNNVASIHTPLQTAEALFVLTTNERLLCLCKKTGHMQWEVPLGDLVVNKAKHYCDKKQKKTYHSPSFAHSWTQPLFINDAIVLYRTDGLLVLCDPQTGAIRQTCDMKPNLLGFLIMENRLYLLNQDGWLFAYEKR